MRIERRLGSYSPREMQNKLTVAPTLRHSGPHRGCANYETSFRRISRRKFLPVLSSRCRDKSVSPSMWVLTGAKISHRG